MPTILSRPYSNETTSSVHPKAWPKWLREPLVHFLVLGALLFTIDYFISGRDDDPRTINVDAAVDSQARQVFSEARGRAPNDEELYALRRVWLDNEVLYREGLAL
ncbi:MAG: peptidyl-prolyl cis-trans isomerase, partial [Pseudomonadota bacterium]